MQRQIQRDVPIMSAGIEAFSSTISITSSNELGALPTITIPPFISELA